jgi:hypothetical protein
VAIDTASSLQPAVHVKGSAIWMQRCKRVSSGDNFTYASDCSRQRAMRAQLRSIFGTASGIRPLAAKNRTRCSARASNR